MRPIFRTGRLEPSPHPSTRHRRCTFTLFFIFPLSLFAQWTLSQCPFSLASSFFHYACLRDAHRVSPASIRAETAAEKYRAPNARSSTQMGISSPGWNRSPRLQPLQFVRVKTWRGLEKDCDGAAGRGERKNWKGTSLTGRHGFRLRLHPRRKRETFRGRSSWSPALSRECYSLSRTRNSRGFWIIKDFRLLNILPIRWINTYNLIIILEILFMELVNFGFI